MISLVVTYGGSRGRRTVDSVDKLLKHEEEVDKRT